MIAVGCDDALQRVTPGALPQQNKGHKLLPGWGFRRSIPEPVPWERALEADQARQREGGQSRQREERPQHMRGALGGQVEDTP